MLPKHGPVHGVFLLTRAARLKPRRSIGEWIEAARLPQSYLAATVDLAEPASALIRLGYARENDGVIVVDPTLLALSDIADRPTLCGIARLLLAADPPLWMSVAVTSAGVAREYIPDADLTALRWLEPDLDHVLLDVHSDLAAQEPRIVQEALGEAAELFVMAALEKAGASPVHVARLSDRYGYDIEARRPARRRIEVKAAGSTTRGTFHLSRNEFDKSQIHAPQWHLLQVVFSSAALLAERLDWSHVEGIFELYPYALSAIVPPDSSNFRWTESAFIQPPASAWRTSGLELDPSFTLPGIRTSRTPK